jgi:hypothetical protein
MCAVNDSLLTQNMDLYSNSAAQNPNVSTKPITSTDATGDQAKCALFDNDMVKCRGFCKPIPTECVDGLNRLCRISYWRGQYYYMRIYGITYDNTSGTPVAIVKTFYELKDDIILKGGRLMNWPYI